MEPGLGPPWMTIGQLTQGFRVRWALAHEDGYGAGHSSSHCFSNKD